MAGITDITLVDVTATLHLQHTDVASIEHRNERVSGTITFNPLTGKNIISLSTVSGKAFSECSGIICLLDILDNILFGDDDQKETKASNIIELSPDGYRIKERISLGNYGYALKNASIEKVEDNHYSVTIETWHRYKFALSSKIQKVLTSCNAIINSPQRGILHGRGSLYLLTNEQEIMTVFSQVEILLNNDTVQLAAPQIFSYRYHHDTTDTVPFTMKADGAVRIINEPINDED